jgi:two-component system CheB/CheR fusion protein
VTVLDQHREAGTPLTPVLATAAMLKGDQSLREEVREDLEVIRRKAELEARLIDDLLDLTRIARGKITLNRQPVELAAILRHAVEVCRPDIEARQLHFDLDGACENVMVNADTARLQQVFWNLLKNSIKFTPKDGCLAVRCWIKDGDVITEVSDSGIGIEAEALARLFTPFEQASHSITRQFGGLGLAISKSLVEMHGGTISARSAGRGQGATFRVMLPVFSPAAADVLASQDQGRAPAPRSLRILVVEDHRDTARTMARLLRMSGHQMRTAGDVASALQAVAQQPIDLLISDLGLPERSGLELMQKLRASGNNVPGIALSGYGQDEDDSRSREVGFATHVTKPIEFEQLTRAMAAVMEKSGHVRSGGTE